MRHSLMKAVLFFLLSVFIFGCSSKINEENYNRIKVGMSSHDVNEVLGEPTKVTRLSFGDVIATHAIWEDRNATISVQYFNDLVKIKNYAKGVTRPRDY